MFTTNYPAAARSAVFTFAAAGSAGLNNLVALPSGCTSPCNVTVSAPLGSSQVVQVPLYASPDGSGMMASFTVSLNRSTVAVGSRTPITVTENAVDAAGEALALSFVSANFTTRNFAVSVADPLGLLGTVPNANQHSTVSYYSDTALGSHHRQDAPADISCAYFVQCEVDVFEG